MIDKRKKVLFLNSLYYPNVGGVENSIKEMSKSLHEQGYDVHLLCSNRNFTNDIKLSNHDVDEYLTIYRYDVIDVGYIIQIFNCLKLLKNLANDNSYSLYISRGYVTSFCLALLNKKFFYLVPSVIFEQDKVLSKSFTFKKKINYFISSCMQIFSFNRAKNIVFSPGMLEQVGKFTFGKKKILQANFGVDSEKFKPLTDHEKKKLKISLNLDVKRKYLLCLGRFSEVKNFEIAIRSMTHLNAEYHLLLVGEGPQKEVYERIIKQSKLSEKVSILNATNTPEIFYQVSDAFLMTSRYESFGQVLLEATSSFLPIVAFKPSKKIMTNVRNIYSEHSSLVFYSDEVDDRSLASAVNIACDSVLKEENVKSFLEKYSWLKLTKDLINQFDVK